MLHYDDPYLAPKVTYDRQQRATDDVALLGTFTTEWTERLEVLRAYVIICLECTITQGDAFDTKLAHYQREYKTAIAQAKAANVGATDPNAIFAAIPLERA